MKKNRSNPNGDFCIWGKGEYLGENSEGKHWETENLKTREDGGSTDDKEARRGRECTGHNEILAVRNRAVKKVKRTIIGYEEILRSKKKKVIYYREE